MTHNDNHFLALVSVLFACKQKDQFGGKLFVMLISVLRGPTEIGC